MQARKHDLAIGKGGTAKILKLESVTKDDKLQIYETQAVKAGKKSDVKMGPDGKLLVKGK